MWSFVFTFLVFFVYGVLYYTVQLCRAAITMLFAYFIYFETSKVWKFYKENEGRIIQFELLCCKTALFNLFLYICEWRQILLKKRGQRTLITVVLWFYFTFKAALFYHFCLVAFDFLDIEFLQQRCVPLLNFGVHSTKKNIE